MVTWLRIRDEGDQPFDPRDSFTSTAGLLYFYVVLLPTSSWISPLNVFMILLLSSNLLGIWFFVLDRGASVRT